MEKAIPEFPEANFETKMLSRMMQLETDIKKLKANFTKLRKSTKESEEIMAFQGQLTELHDQIKYFPEWLLIIRRRLTRADIRLEIHWITEYVSGQAKADPTKSAVSVECNVKLRELGLLSLGNMETALEPETVYTDFYSRCKTVMTRYGFQDYFPA